MEFVTDAFSEDESNIAAIGVECPESLRETSQLVEPFDMIEKRNLLEKARIYDYGNVEIDELEPRIKEFLSKNKLPITLAKEHTVTLHAMKSMPENTKLIIFDAHADLKDEYEESKYSHACWLRRWCELSEDNCKNVIIIGVRSCDEDELEYMESKGITYLTNEDVKNNIKKVEEFIGDSPFYISIDMDVFDPSIAPAVKYPEPDGISYSDFISITSSLKGKLSGMDCVEIRPIENNMITEFLAIKIIFKILGNQNL